MPILIIMFKGVIGDIVSPILSNVNNGTSATTQSSNLCNLIPNPSSHTFYSAFRKDSFLNSSFQSLNSNKNHSQLVSTYIISDTDRRANTSSLPRKQGSVGNNSLERSSNINTNSNSNNVNSNSNNNYHQPPANNFGLNSNRNNYLNSIKSIL